MSSRVAEPVPGARALFVFHLALLSWWLFVLICYYVVLRFVKVDPAFPLGVVSLGMIVTALIVFTRFARGRRGTASETAARVAAALAIVDVIGESLQFAPRLGFPIVIPGDGSTAELVVRLVWASCEYSMRVAMFLALWRAQPELDKRLVRLFFALIGVNYLATWIAFTRAAGPLREFWSDVRLATLIGKLNMPMGLLWLSIIVYLSWRLARGSSANASAVTARAV